MKLLPVSCTFTVRDSILKKMNISSAGTLSQGVDNDRGSIDVSLKVGYWSVVHFLSMSPGRRCILWPTMPKIIQSASIVSKQRDWSLIWSLTASANKIHSGHTIPPKAETAKWVHAINGYTASSNQRNIPKIPNESPLVTPKRNETFWHWLSKMALQTNLGLDVRKRTPRAMKLKCKLPAEAPSKTLDFLSLNGEKLRESKNKIAISKDLGQKTSLFAHWEQANHRLPFYMK